MERFFFALCVAPFGASSCFFYRRISERGRFGSACYDGRCRRFWIRLCCTMRFRLGFCSLWAERRPSGLDGAGHASAIAALGRMNAPRDLMHLTKSAKCGILTVYF